MYPHERSLVKKLESKPFALLGVNTDRNLEQLKKDMQANKITWRSWFDGGTSGPICRQYGVSVFPSLFIIDAKGVVRYTFVGGPDPAQLDRAVDTLLKETSAGS
jgi:hypothetical protein